MIGEDRIGQDMIGQKNGGNIVVEERKSVKERKSQIKKK